jgi:predicted dehydrogenase
MGFARSVRYTGEIMDASKIDLTRRGLLQGLTAAAAVQPALRAEPKKVRIGIVGGRFGAGFQWHLDPDCQVTAVCDIAPQALAHLSTTYHCPTTYHSFREMLRHPGLDAVGVFTPAPLHAWMVSEAMKAGKHVISAVPAGMSVEQLEMLLDTVKRTGMKYMMAETSYYRSEIIACREMAREGKFGTIFYSEAEYHHEGVNALGYDDRGYPTWRYGLPPMLYPTHCTGMVVPVTGERLSEVYAIGWGDGHEMVRSNQYQNPFWNTTGFFKTSGGHSARISVFWHVAAGGVERSQFYGDRMSFYMARPEKSPDTIVRISKNGQTMLDANGYPEGKVSLETAQIPDFFDRLPEPMRVQTGHGNSHTFLTHEFVRAILENRQPTVNIWEAVAYTLPGIVAHQSALRGGELMKIKDYGTAPA